MDTQETKKACSVRPDEDPVTERELTEQEVEEAVDRINPDPESMESRG